MKERCMREEGGGREEEGGEKREEGRWRMEEGGERREEREEGGKLHHSTWAPANSDRIVAMVLPRNRVGEARPPEAAKGTCCDRGGRLIRSNSRSQLGSS